MHLDELFPPADLKAALDAGHVTRKTHPTLPLAIFTYARVCQYERIWNPVTMTCRGLVVDENTGEIVAYPFPKIFVTDMHGQPEFPFAPPLPAEPFEIFEKIDGSLIIVFHYDGRWHAASKGSFISEQAQWAQKWLDRRDTSRLDPELTYLAEAMYPGNRIVVDYGIAEDLVLLATYRPADGTDIPLTDDIRLCWHPVGAVVTTWGMQDDVHELARRAAADLTLHGNKADGQIEEGYVIRYASGQRAKIKLASYLVLHKLFTGTNERTVWEALATGQDLADLFDRVPDEFADWVRGVAARLNQQHAALMTEARSVFAAVMADVPIGLAPDEERKVFAQKAVESPYKATLFCLYDDRLDRVKDWAWKQIRPRGDKPFKNDEDN